MPVGLAIELDNAQPATNEARARYKLMKTLADLKRALSVGNSLTLIAPTTHKFHNLKRYIIKTQGNGVYLNTDKEAIKGSFMELPAASLVEYDNDIFTIYDFGERDLTAEEKTLLDNAPSKRKENAETVKMDILTDGNQMFWADKRYFKENNAEYLEGHDWQGSLRYNWNSSKVWDKKIKGAISLQYKIEK